MKAEVKAIEDGLLNDDKVSAKLIQLEDRFQRNSLQIDRVKDELNEKKIETLSRINWELKMTWKLIHVIGQILIKQKLVKIWTVHTPLLA